MSFGAFCGSNCSARCSEVQPTHFGTLLFPKVFKFWGGGLVEVFLYFEGGVEGCSQRFSLYFVGGGVTLTVGGEGGGASAVVGRRVRPRPSRVCAKIVPGVPLVADEWFMEDGKG